MQKDKTDRLLPAPLVLLRALLLVLLLPSRQLLLSACLSSNPACNLVWQANTPGSAAPRGWHSSPATRHVVSIVEVMKGHSTYRHRQSSPHNPEVQIPATALGACTPSTPRAVIGSIPVLSLGLRNVDLLEMPVTGDDFIIL